jgi:hypothetical protein
MTFSNHKTIVFLQDFATKKIGDEWSCDSMTARSLVDRGIAEFKTEDKKKSNSTTSKKQK